MPATKHNPTPDPRMEVAPRPHFRGSNPPKVRAPPRTFGTKSTWPRVQLGNVHFLVGTGQVRHSGEPFTVIRRRLPAGRFVFVFGIGNAPYGIGVNAGIITAHLRFTPNLKEKVDGGEFRNGASLGGCCSILGTSNSGVGAQPWGFIISRIEFRAKISVEQTARSYLAGIFDPGSHLPSFLRCSSDHPSWPTQEGNQFRCERTDRPVSGKPIVAHMALNSFNTVW